MRTLPEGQKGLRGGGAGCSVRGLQGPKIQVRQDGAHGQQDHVGDPSGQRLGVGGGGNCGSEGKEEGCRAGEEEGEGEGGEDGEEGREKGGEAEGESGEAKGEWVQGEGQAPGSKEPAHGGRHLRGRAGGDGRG